MKATKLRTYSELIRLQTFEERFEYAKLGGIIGESTFGFDRYLNQALYTSPEWRSLRHRIIVRDNGCDLGIDGMDIGKYIVVHHLNPITIEDLDDRNTDILNPEYLICVSRDTHNAIHFGDANLLSKAPIERKPNDTCPWKG